MSGEIGLGVAIYDLLEKSTAFAFVRYHVSTGGVCDCLGYTKKFIVFTIWCFPHENLVRRSSAGHRRISHSGATGNTVDSINDCIITTPDSDF